MARASLPPSQPPQSPRFSLYPSHLVFFFPPAAEEDNIVKTCSLYSLNRFLERRFGPKGQSGGKREGCGNNGGGGGVESLWLGMECVVWGLSIKLK